MDAENWDAIVRMTKSAMLTLQSSAIVRGYADKFITKMATRDGRTVLLTKHVLDGIEVKTYCIMRFEDTGSIFPCKWCPSDWKWKPMAAPQAWIKLRDKPIEEIWKAFGLTDFTMKIDIPQEEPSRVLNIEGAI